ncbi:uncharacterized protein dikar [Anabrus simplex]|uniref:uncharacterized protein dikar n=1 Tax=Anabrus simplex TaxID=316456 RepID=UPI0035A2F606
MQMDDIQSWWEVPSIAHFCSLFRAAFNLLDFDIEELEEALLTDGTEDCGSSLLQELIVRLLCGCLGNNDISTFNYQMFLRRLFRQKCQEYGRDNPFNTDMDFQFLPLRTKVEILHALCDFRLDADDVQDVLKNLESDSLRVEPLGYDENNSAYWYFYGTRLYKEDYPKFKKKAKEKRRKGKEEKKRKKHSKSPSESDTEEKIPGVWKVICFTEQDWDKITESFKDSRSKSERALYHTLSEDFLPEIPRLFLEKERLQRKRLLEYQPRRQSSRLEKLKQQKEEEKELLQRELEERLRHQQQEQEKKDRLLQQESRSNRALLRSISRTNSECGSTGSLVDSISDNRSNRSSTFVGRQTNNSLSSATGQIVIQGLRRKLRSSQVFKQTEEDLQTGMYKILEHIKNHEDAWPFMEPVDEEYAPRYYSIISKPMDLQRMEDKLDEGEYLSFAEFKADFKLIVDNCRQYNGTDNEYTEMVGNLQEAFQAAVNRYLESDPSSDEEVAVEFPDDQPQDHAQSRRSTHSHRQQTPRKKEEEPEPELPRSPTPVSIPSPPSSIAEENEPEHEKEIEEKSEEPVPEAPDTEGSSTKDGVDSKHQNSNNSMKRKKKTGVIKNAAAIEALELATEQTLKDINKWLDDTPRFSEFSSASNSPSHFIGAEEYEVVGSRIDNEYRRNLKLDRPPRTKDSKDSSKRRPTKDASKRRREIQRTIERLQPGKSKGNLISNIQSASKVTEEGSTLGKPKDTRNSLITKPDETTPKLSLGTVLGSDVLGFGVGQNSHSFDVEDKHEELKSEISADDGIKPSIEMRVKTPEPQIDKIISDPVPLKSEKEELEIKSSNKDTKQDKVTPNHSAWFKAFGAPKPASAPKRKAESVQEISTSEMISMEERRNQVLAHGSSPGLIEIPSMKSDIVRPLPERGVIHKLTGDVIRTVPLMEEVERKAIISPHHKTLPDEAMSPQQQITPRQRKISTGSSVSERSSFSQDLMDPLDGSSPRLSMDERLGCYPAPYPSPMHRSPMAASPVMASPRPEEGLKLASYPPLNGTIRVGFYQDTSSSLQKSSPEKSNSSCSPRDQLPTSPFPTYPPRMYPPPHDPGGFLPYQSHAPGPPGPTSTSESIYDNLPLYSASPVMQYYDTSKPLTDQYRAARTQPSDNYSPPTVTSSLSSSSSSHQQGVDIPQSRPNAIHKTPSVIPVKKRLYSEIDSSSGSQAAVRFCQTSVSPTTHASDRLHLSALENQHGMDKLTDKKHSSTSASLQASERILALQNNERLSQPSSIITSVGDRQQGLDMSSRRTPEILHQSSRPEKQSHSAVTERLQQSPARCSTSSPSDRLQQTPLGSPQASEVSQTSKQRPVSSAQISEKESTSAEDLSKVSDRLCSSPEPQSTVRQHQNNSTLAHQANDSLHRITVNKAGISQDQPSSAAERLQQTPVSSVDTEQSSDKLHPTVTTSVSLLSERLHQNSVSSIRSGDLSFHRGPFSPVPPSSLGMDPLALRGNLANLSHIVDRFPPDERLLTGLQAAGSPFYGEKGLGPQHIFGQSVSTTLPTSISSTSAAMAMFSQPSSAIMTMAYNHDSRMVPSPIAYSRSVSELSSALSNKTSDIQSYNRTVPELSSMLPSKTTPPLNVQPAFNRTELSGILPSKVSSPLTVQTAYNRTVTNLSSVLPGKSTPPMDLQTTYKHSVSDLSSILSNKVSVPQPLSVPSSYNRSATDYSILSTKTTESQPVSKSSRKRKSKQAVSSSEVSVVSSAASSTAFQQYVGLKNSTAVSEPSAIALKTTSVVPGSAFNFGPAPSGLGLYTDKESYPGFLEDYRTASSSFFMAATDPGREKISQSSHPATPSSPFQFLSHPQPRPPGYPSLAPAFMNHHQPALVDASGAATPLYQQYLQRHQEELLRHSGTPMVLHQGLLGPPTGYPPGYHPALGIRQPYDTLNRPAWL